MSTSKDSRSNKHTKSVRRSIATSATVAAVGFSYASLATNIGQSEAFSISNPCISLGNSKNSRSSACSYSTSDSTTLNPSVSSSSSNGLFYKFGGDVDGHLEQQFLNASPPLTKVMEEIPQGADGNGREQEEQPQENLDGYLEFLDRRYNRLRRKDEPQPQLSGPTATWNWIFDHHQSASGSSEGVIQSNNDQAREDALYALGVADLASNKLLQKYHSHHSASGVKMTSLSSVGLKLGTVAHVIYMMKTEKQNQVLKLSFDCASKVFARCLALTNRFVRMSLFRMKWKFHFAIMAFMMHIVNPLRENILSSFSSFSPSRGQLKNE